MGKYLISVDIEGITGVVDGSFAKANGANYHKGCQYMLHDVNAVIDGILLADEAADIVVRDAHGSAINLVLDGLNAKAQLLQGWDAAQNMLTGLTKEFDGVFLVGYHARGDRLEAVLAHTMSSLVAELRLNDQLINEAILFALYAATMRVPVLLISGDDVVVDETEAWLGSDLVGVVVKKSLGRAAVLSCSLQQSRECLVAGAKLAVERLLQKDNLCCCQIPDKLAFSLRINDLAFRRSIFAELQGILGFDATYQFETDVRIVRFKVDDMLEGLYRINLIMHLLYGIKALI